MTAYLSSHGSLFTLAVAVEGTPQHRDRNANVNQACHMVLTSGTRLRKTLAPFATPNSVSAKTT